MSDSIETLRKSVRPLLVFESERLSQYVGLPVLIGSETLQHTGSFKYRAALNAVLNSTARHLATTSSGNFGQALAFACKREGRDCTVIMPDNSSTVKIEATRSLGADVRLVDLRAKSRQAWLEEIIASIEDQIETISPYDDDRVIAGNSSLVHDLSPIADCFDTIVVPIGGGGLSAGIIKGARALNHKWRIIGAEPHEANDASRSLKQGVLLANQEEPSTLADGARTISLGKRNWEVLKDGLETIVEIGEKEIVTGLKLHFELANLKVEPTAALSLAALISDRALFVNSRPLIIVSGANVEASQFASLIN